MATYYFEYITPAQAAAYNAASDELIVTSNRVGEIDVVYSGSTITLYSTTTGAYRAFGTGLGGEEVTFPGGDVIRVGTSGGDRIVTGTGSDALHGGPGADTLTGGPGGDTFAIGLGHSGTVAGAIDVVTDWQVEDHMAFATRAATQTDYVEGSAADYAAALSYANGLIAGGTVNYVAVAVSGSGVAVFADSGNDNGGADDAVMLANANLVNIGFLNIAGTLSTMPPQDGSAQTGTAGADTLAGGPGGDSLAGGAGDDRLEGAAGADTLAGEAGNDTENGGDGDDLFLAGPGNDIISGGLGVDTISFIGATSGVKAALKGYYPDELGGGLGKDALRELEVAIGSPFADTITGADYASTIMGGAGNDQVGGLGLIYGEAGDDRVYVSGGVGVGGTGNDSLNGETSGSTSIQLYGGPGDDVMTGSFSVGGMWGEDGNDTLTGPSAADGGDGNDVIKNASLVNGGAGDDSITSGYGAQITTGAGADLITFVTPAHGGLSRSQLATITDWTAQDRIAFQSGAMPWPSYVEATASDFGAAFSLASTAIARGVNVVAVGVGADVMVFADGADDNIATQGALLAGRSLADVEAGQFVGSDAAPAPPRSLPGAVGASGTVTGNPDTAHLGGLLGTDILDATSTSLQLNGHGESLNLAGRSFTYDANEQLTGGTATYVGYASAAAGVTFALNTPGVSAAPFGAWVANDATQLALQTVLAGDDRLSGGSGADLIRGYAGNDVLAAGLGADTLYGGLGDDVLTASGPGSTYLRGDEGDDWIAGGRGFDDANGNMGNDTVAGGAGADWVVGGKDNDLLFGEAGDDIVYGNLGEDTGVGGDGADLVRGGQGNDTLSGGAGADWLSGDRGDDTIVGGAGADIFHGSQDAGIDRILDFSVADGDRVQLDPGTTYAVSQSGGDVLIDMGGGNYMQLVGVQLTSLPQGWIFGA